MVNGTAASPASRSVSSRRAGSLSGEPKCGPPRADSRSADDSSMIPCDALTLRSRARSDASITPGFTCGRRPVSSSTAPRRPLEILERRRAPQPGELLTRRAVAQLRLSPSVKSASWQPAAAPARATASTSSIDMNARSPRRGGRANVQ